MHQADKVGCGQIWLSTSSDLHNDAIRDLRALGCHVSVINNCQTLDKETRATGLSKWASEGVLFMCGPCSTRAAMPVISVGLSICAAAVHFTFRVPSRAPDWASEGMAACSWLPCPSCLQPVTPMPLSA